jgi:hypothetical protein
MSDTINKAQAFNSLKNFEKNSKTFGIMGEGQHISFVVKFYR